MARVGAFLGLDEITNDGHQGGEEGGEVGEGERGKEGGEAKGEEKQQTNPLSAAHAAGSAPPRIASADEGRTVTLPDPFTII